MPFMLFPINSWKWRILFLQWPTSPLLISWSCTSAIYGNCMEFHLYMVPIAGLLSQQTLWRISTRNLELNHDFLLHTTPRHRDRLEITTSGWKCTFRCSVHISRMIGWIYSWQRNLPTIITTINQSTQPLSSWIMDTTQPWQTYWVLDSLVNPMNGSTRSTKHRRSANTQSSDLRRFPNECTINGRMRTLVSKLGIQFGLKQPTSQLMNLLQSLQARDTVPLRSRTSPQTWLITSSCLCVGEFTMFSMLMSCWKQSPTQFCDVGSQHHLLLRLMMRISGLWRSMWMPDGSGTNSNSRYNGMDFQKSTIPGKTQTALTLTMDPKSWERLMMISIWKRTSITDTLTLWRELTLLLLKDSQPDNRGYAISPWGHGLLVGGTVMILLFFLCFPPILSILLCSITPTTLHSTTDPWSTNFSIFCWLLSHIALLSSAVLTYMTS